MCFGAGFLGSGWIDSVSWLDGGRCHAGSSCRKTAASLAPSGLSFGDGIALVFKAHQARPFGKFHLVDQQIAVSEIILIPYFYVLAFISTP